MLTRDEALLAAKVADTYPKGMGQAWGYKGALSTTDCPETAAAIIARRKDKTRYG